MQELGETRLVSHILTESSCVKTEKHEAVWAVVPYKALSPPTWLPKKPAAAGPQRSTFATFHTSVKMLVPSWLQSHCFAGFHDVTAISSKTGVLLESTARETRTRSNIAAVYFFHVQILLGGNLWPTSQNLIWRSSLGKKQLRKAERTTRAQSSSC